MILSYALYIIHGSIIYIRYTWFYPMYYMLNAVLFYVLHVIYGFNLCIIYYTKFYPMYYMLNAVLFYVLSVEDFIVFCISFYVPYQCV
jgi:hypothetical protein